MRTLICIAVGALLSLPVLVCANENRYSNRLAYWTPPMAKEMPQSWRWTQPLPGKTSYWLGYATLLPASEWVVCTIFHGDAYDPDDKFDLVGLLGIDLKSGKRRLLSPPDATAILEFRFTANNCPRLSPSTVGAIIKCRLLTHHRERTKISMRPRWLEWSWNPQTGELEAVGNSVPAGTLLYALADTPYSVSWLDREQQAWSGWTMVMERRAGRFLGYLQAAKRMEYPKGQEFIVDPFHSRVIRKPRFEEIQFHPTGNPHRILRRDYHGTSRSGDRRIVLECLDLKNDNAVVWKLDSREEPGAGDGTPPFVQFCDGMMRPCRHVVLRSLPAGTHPQEIWILDTEDGTVDKKFQLPPETSRAFEPDVSGNGRFVMLETGRYLDTDGDKEPKRRLYVLDTHSGQAVLHKPLDSSSPMYYPVGILNDGTAVLRSDRGIAAWKPPYKEEPELVYDFRATDPTIVRGEPPSGSRPPQPDDNRRDCRPDRRK